MGIRKSIRLQLAGRRVQASGRVRIGISCGESAGHKLRAVRWDQHHDPAPRRIRAMNPAALRPRGADSGQESRDASTRLGLGSTLERNCATLDSLRFERVPVVCFEYVTRDSTHWILRLENCVRQVRSRRRQVKTAPRIMLCSSPLALHRALCLPRSFLEAQTRRRARTIEAQRGTGAYCTGVQKKAGRIVQGRACDLHDSAGTMFPRPVPTSPHRPQK
jgi:hypothetical protein